MPTAPTPQTFKNHAKLDPPFHFVIAPLLVFLFVESFLQLTKGINTISISLVVISILSFVMAFRLRTYPLKVQDRIIRLEEQSRMARLLPEDLRTRATQLTVSQYVALRFASDAELASLVRLTLDQNLTNRQIKERIVNWRPDYDRI